MASKHSVRYSIVLALVSRFSTLKEGEGLTYEELEEVMGCDPRENRSLIHQAARRVLHEGKTIDCRVKVGYFRIKDREVKSVVERRVNRGDRQHETALLVSTYGANRENLSPDEQRDLDHSQFKAATRVLLARKMEREKITEDTKIELPTGNEMMKILEGRKEL